MSEQSETPRTDELENKHANVEQCAPITLCHEVWDDVRSLERELSEVTRERNQANASRRVHELDNHHNALVCGYCSGPLKDQLVAAERELEALRGKLRMLRARCEDMSSNEIRTHCEDALAALTPPEK